MPTVNKVIATNAGALQRKYGGGWATIRSAIDGLIASDLARGLSSRLVLLDDAAQMTLLGGVAVLAPDSPRQNLEAVNAALAALAPTYLLLLGSIDVIPYQDLTNPVYGDGDLEFDPDPVAWSDLPYAAGAPYGQDIGASLPPSVAVGRLPDVTGGTNPDYLVGLLTTAKDYTSRPRSLYTDYMGLSKREWLGSTQLSLTADFGGASAVHTIPTEHSPWSSGLLLDRSHFINCEGLPFDSRFYAADPHLPTEVALDAAELTDHLSGGTVVAAECCFAAQLYDPAVALGKAGICNAYLANGAYGFFGSTTVAYGGAATNDFADWICQSFMKHVLAGTSLGEAALLARQDYVSKKSPLSPIDLKTLAQFTLLGDPSLRPITSRRRR
jgi:hypothetical protein